jgi:hypothetical protein
MKAAVCGHAAKVEDPSDGRRTGPRGRLPITEPYHAITRPLRGCFGPPANLQTACHNRAAEQCHDGANKKQEGIPLRERGNPDSRIGAAGIRVRSGRSPFLCPPQLSAGHRNRGSALD